jgi:hypothetical protein
MQCLICRDLKRVYDAGLSKYIEARSSAIYSFSTKFAAYRNVEMERAKSSLEEHRRVCGCADRVIVFSPERITSAAFGRLAA